MIVIVFCAAVLAVGIWAGLILFWGKFWWADQRLSPLPTSDRDRQWPAVTAVIPARDEAATIGQTVASLLQQNYPGRLAVVVVDDNSDDGTGAIARDAAAGVDATDRFHLVTGKPLADGWSGKLWAVQQGIEAAKIAMPDARYLLLTDADIVHHPDNLAELATKAELEHRDLVSLMVHLNCRTVWERLLIPAFIFFFQKLYPFPWVNDPTKRIAAAAGGCMLIRSTALETVGGLREIRGRLIDDCALAALIKRRGTIWLGLSQRTISLRRYERLGEIWHMVARTAFEQLNHSWVNLIGAVIGMILLYIVPPVAMIIGLWIDDMTVVAAGFGGWAMMSLAYLPTVRLYDRPTISVLTLPVAGLLYTLMTLDSARLHWVGKGGGWKGRTYANASARMQDP